MFVRQVFDEISATLVGGETVMLSAFGSFVVHHKKERMGINFKTGEPAPISARRIGRFKPSSLLKRRINRRTGCDIRPQFLRRADHDGRGLNLKTADGAVKFLYTFGIGFVASSMISVVYRFEPNRALARVLIAIVCLTGTLAILANLN